MLSIIPSIQAVGNVVLRLAGLARLAGLVGLARLAG
jgi:hypothetical protein